MLLELLEQLYRHRIEHLDKYCSPPKLNTTDYILPSKKEISAYLSGQLPLFPLNSGTTLLQWNRNKVDFLELFTAIHESKSVKTIDDRKLTKKEFIELVMWFFNIQIKHWEGSLSAAKSRKNDNESPYITELARVFKEYTYKEI